MLFNYRATTKEGVAQEGSIEAPNTDAAISSLQNRSLIVLHVEEANKKSWLKSEIPLFSGIKSRDVVILSRQIATLFGAKVSVLQTFRLLASESSNPTLRNKLVMITDDIKGGIAISEALAKHPD